MALSIQQAIEKIKSRFGKTVGTDTVDTLKSGDPSQGLRGIVVTFLVNRTILDQTVATGANLIITHEPTYYNHHDHEDWLKGDPVYESKKEFIDKHGIVIWRLHDYIHVQQPDMIFTGMVRALNWQDCVESSSQRTIRLPNTTLHELAKYCKARLGIESIRYVGDPAMPCSVVAMRVGSPGGESQMEMLRKEGIDVLITGETAEWQTCDYVRDCTAAGRKKAMIVLGHANSEEGGVRWVAEWITQAVPETTVTYLKTGDPFHFV